MQVGVRGYPYGALLWGLNGLGEFFRRRRSRPRRHRPEDAFRYVLFDFLDVFASVVHGRPKPYFSNKASAIWNATGRGPWAHFVGPGP